MSDLSNAIDRGSIIEVKKLIDSGVNLKDKLIIGEEYDIDSADEVSVLNYAVRKHAGLELIKFLIENGADLFETDKEGVSILDIAIKFKRYDIVAYCCDNGFDINATKRKSGMLPIILASCFNDVDMIKLLLEKGAKLEAKDKSGMNAYDYAKKMGQEKVAKFLENLEKEKDE